tara:strand:- start:1115 stop:1375 length:261 start_codon:yes stop_codon:yes gene_type:complete
MVRPPLFRNFGTPQRGRPQQWLLFTLVRFSSLIKPLQFKTTTEVKAFPREEGWMGLLNKSSVLQNCKIYNTEPWMGLFVTCKSIAQ